MIKHNSNRSDNRSQRASQLNGNNGEWTNGDDMPKKTRTRGATRKDKKNESKKRQKRVKRFAQSMAREAIIGAAGLHVGPGMARLGYKAANHMVKNLTKGEKRLVLSEVASKYLQSYLKPFDFTVRQACIPTTPSYPTYKVMGFIRGTGYIGLQGMGFVAMAPCITNDGAAVYYTTAAYNQSMVAQAASDSANLSGGANIPAVATFNNIPYTTAQITSTTPNAKIEGRIVSCSLRAQFTGTELNRSGLVYAYADPEGDNVLGGPHTNATAGSGYTVATISEKEATEIYPVTKGFTQLVALPPYSYALDFTNQNASAVRQAFPYTSSEYNTLNSNSQGSASLLIMFTGVPGQSFYYEAVVHAEYVGAGVVQSLLSETFSDVVGLDAVQNVLGRAQRRCAGDPQITFSKALQKEMEKEKIVFGGSRRSVDY